MTAPASLSIVYANDEDIAIVACGDYIAIAPKWQCLARGTTGVFSSGNLWQLTCVGVDFEAVGVAYGNIVHLTNPNPPFKGNGELFAVSSVNSTGVTLRRIGLGTSVGNPPALVGGLTGVAFEARTLYPQIESASYDINQIFNIDPAGQVGQTPERRYDSRDLRKLTVYAVLHNQYEIANRNANGEFDLKLKQIKDEYDSLKDRLRIRWGTTGQADQPSSIVGSRLTR